MKLSVLSALSIAFVASAVNASPVIEERHRDDRYCPVRTVYQTKYIPKTTTTKTKVVTKTKTTCKNDYWHWKAKTTTITKTIPTTITIPTTQVETSTITNTATAEAITSSTTLTLDPETITSTSTLRLDPETILLTSIIQPDPTTVTITTTLTPSAITTTTTPTPIPSTSTCTSSTAPILLNPHFDTPHTPSDWTATPLLNIGTVLIARGAYPCTGQNGINCAPHTNTNTFLINAFSSATSDSISIYSLSQPGSYPTCVEDGSVPEEGRLRYKVSAWALSREKGCMLALLVGGRELGEVGLPTTDVFFKAGPWEYTPESKDEKVEVQARCKKSAAEGTGGRVLMFLTDVLVEEVVRGD